MSKKPKPILLWDIVPGKWYLRRNPKHATLQDLVQVNCDATTTGWERGHVIISDRHWDRARVAVTSTDKSVSWVGVRVPYNDYRFSFSDGGWVTLFEVPDGFVEQQTAAYNSEMDSAIAKYNNIKGILDANAIR